MRRKKAFRDYPPLATACLAVLALLAVLPSSLNLPTSDPSETVELAPVPPGDDDPPPPPAGNFSSLGLASSGSVAENPVGDPDLGTPPATGRGKTPSTKRCVGRPPRQSEDPLSPPCVAFFEGDNGGATHRGVTADEIRLLLFVGGDGFSDTGSRGDIVRPTGVCFDTSKPRESEEESYWVDAARILQRYFNERYQTYNRLAYFHVCFSSDDNVESRRADAVSNLKTAEPFAAITRTAPAGNELPYIETLARRGVLNFGAVAQNPKSVFLNYPGLIWSYQSSREQFLAKYVNYVCTKVVPHPVSFGNDSEIGQPRKLGLIYTTDTDFPSKTEFAREARKQIQACGGNFVAEGTYPQDDFICCYSADQQAQNIATLRSQGVTTILWPQGFETHHTRIAAESGYTPEWILAGDSTNDDAVAGKYQDARAWANAVVVTEGTVVPPWEQTICFQAIRQADPSFPREDMAIPCRLFNDVRQIFTGIQVAGPKLNPQSMDRGYHAIPAVRSDDPRVPACFYEERDYSCVKDAAVFRWDSTALSPFSSVPGCYRVTERGRRHLQGKWPAGDVRTQQTPEDPCTGYTTGKLLDPAPGPGSGPIQ